MCIAFKCSVYIAVYCVYLLELSAEEGQLLRLKNCTIQGECPDHSICTKVVDNFGCICWQGYHLNPDWSASDLDNTDWDYCVRQPANKTVIVHNRLPAKSEHLAVAILLVLFGVIVVTLVLYCFVALRPISRTRAAYRRMQLRRSNHRRLQEFDDIDMTFRDTHNADCLD
ncbi:uncharacterized protein LOC115764636 [Drosophila novamexicana]|uniref:uncharacterized protein LOC115764636 n=1 Tax=Drosophila novamexicana TaxID=47314 RepID=UPI0011E5AFD8|nr:uncharacterized protein LOC115764636 [Drosophila novamexicana]